MRSVVKATSSWVAVVKNVRKRTRVPRRLDRRAANVMQDLGLPMNMVNVTAMLTSADGWVIAGDSMTYISQTIYPAIWTATRGSIDVATCC